ncbi:MAG: hypothetical protein QOH96_1459, partial [Blastocatellia bacterium]|nr:hypothetical protein [Blastocatellia bacterium]
MKDTKRRSTGATTTHLIVWVVGVLAPFLVSFPPAVIECLRDRTASLSIIKSEKSNGGEDLSPVNAIAAPIKHNGVLKFSYQRHK